MSWNGNPEYSMLSATPLRQDPTIITLLRSGRLPHPSQRGDLESLFQEVEASISDDEDRIWDLKHQVSLLRSRISVLQENKRILSSLSAPIRKAPPEIIQHIFELAVDANHFKDVKSVSVATRVSSVCAQWRSLAHATPRIWASFVVDIVHGTKEWNGVVRSIERHLRFARDAELDLDLRTANVPIAVGHDILQLFAAHASRWRSASFNFGAITIQAREILIAALHNTPSLKSLHIHQPRGFNSGIKIEFFKSCPELRELSLVQYSPQAAIPWTQLTSIHFAASDARDINTVLGLCPHLLSVSLSVPTSTDLELTGPEIVPRTLQIHTLRIESHPGSGRNQALSGVLMVCSGLTLPQLESLAVVSHIRRRYRGEYEARHEEGKWPQAAVEAMLTRSACRLTTLRLEGVPLDTKEALQLLRLAPHAVEVSLHECVTPDPESLSEHRANAVFDDVGANHFITTGLFVALCATPHAPTSPSPSNNPKVPLLPRLRRLELKVNTQFDMSAYMTMVRSRWPGPDSPRVLEMGMDRLDSLSLTVMCHFDSYGFWDSKPLLLLKKEGLLVRYDDGCDEFYDYNDKFPAKGSDDEEEPDYAIDSDYY
ncbi:F-box domain-containing protein [Mycena venus]|uniref:F-box domain-containing protein n=1 Tax=Mycena venus TaxID=2733690 RepID=A0A8H6XY05_9AGAR|nr:F-box domain-containing protein [Mycena venus]